MSSLAQLSVAFLVTTAILKKSYNIYEDSKIHKSPFQPRIVIIGAGMSGICAAIKLKTTLNYHNFIIYERDSDIGGTWFVNNYPGCACDVPGLNYCYSFENAKHWTPLYFPPQAETLQYLKDMCTKYKLYQHIQFNSCVTGMIYNENKKIWNISISISNNKIETISANIVISAVGILSNKKIPKFKNMSAFKGHKFHSSEWDHTYNFTDKKIAVIGIGPTAVQVIPSLEKTKCKKLYLFQKSIGHLLPKGNAPNSSAIWNKLFYIPFIQNIMRGHSYYQGERYRYPCLKRGSTPAQHFEKLAEKYRKHVFEKDKLLMKQTQPHGAPYGKRLLLSDELFHIFKKDKCKIITANIDKFTRDGIMTKDGLNTELDCVVFCTGFRSQEFLCSIKDGVIGKNGKYLQKDVWDINNCFAYLGVVVSGFPNMFLLYGPGTNLAHNSVLFMIECAVNYTIQCIEKMIKNGWNEIDVKENAMNDFVKELDKENDKNAWQDPTITNWFKNDKGRGSTNWAWSCNYYWWLTRSVDWKKYKRSKL